MRYGKWFLLGMFLVGVLAATTSPAHASTFSSIDVPGAFATAAHGINDRGQIVGEYVTITGGASFWTTALSLPSMCPEPPQGLIIAARSSAGREVMASS